MATLNRQSLLAEPYASILIREDRILSITLKGFIKSEQINKVMSVVMGAVKELNSKLILINQQDLKVLSRETQNQIVTNINELNRLVSRVAIIESEDIFAVAGLKAVQKNVHAILLGSPYPDFVPMQLPPTKCLCQLGFFVSNSVYLCN
ncbi:hypothetical protein ACFQ21_29100 [Ohtaekwangia kribbensis]|uniref:STAS domain-containing protein n=1 Tax=Ohtaekwangia kribbensis TaxID=688913 RepID=A0ABW3KBT2_9BACT